MPKMNYASQSAARLLHRRYGGAIADPTALPRMPACKCNNTTASLPFRQQWSLCLTTTNQPTRQVTISFNSPYKRANFRDDFLVYDHITGKTPVLVRSLSGEVSTWMGDLLGIPRVVGFLVLSPAITRNLTITQR